MVEPFTEQQYAILVDAAAEKYRFTTYADRHDGSRVVWRHDVDYSPHRALALARIEAGRGVRCIYHFLVSGRYYNILEADVAAIIRDIAGLGHEIGLHFDMDVFGHDCAVDREVLERRLDMERGIIETVAGVGLGSLSFHNYTLNAARMVAETTLCGLPNASSKHVFDTYRYVSDSNGIWRYDDLEQVLAEPAVPQLHVLTHPEWWTPHGMTPYQRLRRAVDGRARANLGFCLTTMQRDGRLALIGDRLGVTADDYTAAGLPVPDEAAGPNKVAQSS